MAFTDTTESKAAFKMIRQKAHTENNKDFYNEPTPSQLLILAKDLIGDTINTDPSIAVTAGIAEYVECILVDKSGTNGKSYNIFFPGDYSGAFSSEVSGDPLIDASTATLVRDITFIIPEAINTNIIDGPSGPSNGYAPRLLDNGVLVPATSTQDWFLDPFACVVTSEDNLNLSTTGTVQVYLYTGRTVLDRLDANELGGSGETNTASNQGVGGVGVFDTKSGVDLQFRNINAASSKISIVLDSGNKEIDIDVVEGNLNHVSDTANPHLTSLANIGTGTLANLNTAVTDATLDDSSSSRTPSAHTIASHSDTTATGTQLNTLTGSSDADSLHKHPSIEAFAVAMAIALG